MIAFDLVNMWYDLSKVLVTSSLNQDFSHCRMDSMIFSEACKLGMQMKEVAGTRCIIRNLEGVIFEITLN